MQLKPVASLETTERYLTSVEKRGVAGTTDRLALFVRAIGNAFDVSNEIPDDFFVTRQHADRLLKQLQGSVNPFYASLYEDVLLAYGKIVKKRPDYMSPQAVDDLVRFHRKIVLAEVTHNDDDGDAGAVIKRSILTLADAAQARRDRITNDLIDVIERHAKPPRGALAAYYVAKWQGKADSYRVDAVHALGRLAAIDHPLIRQKNPALLISRIASTDDEAPVRAAAQSTLDGIAEGLPIQDVAVIMKNWATGLLRQDDQDGIAQTVVARILHRRVPEGRLDEAAIEAGLDPEAYGRLMRQLRSDLGPG